MAEKLALAVMHAHSEWSHDSRDPLSALAEFAAREQLRWVFLTDHAEDFDSHRFDAYVDECRAHSTREHELIPGLEFRFEGYPGLHLLAIGLRAWISPVTPEAFCREARAHAEFLVMAHPMLAKYRAPDEVLARLHGIEVWNAQYNSRYLPDGMALEFWQSARRRWPHLVVTAGTDQHRLQVEGKVRLQLPRDGNPFDALRAGEFRNQGLTLAFGSAPDWGPMRLKIIAWLRIAVERAKRWRAARERQARTPTISR